jgi:hypothetical protein
MWKEITDAALEQREVQVSQSRSGAVMKKEVLEKLRGDSAKVRELLRIEDSGDDAEPQFVPLAPPARRALPSPVPPLPQAVNRTGGALTGFLVGLGPVESEALRIIAGGGDLSALEDLARERLTMPELIIDTLNGQFNDLFYDILIETADDTLLIQAEYEAEIKKDYGVM